MADAAGGSSEGKAKHAIIRIKRKRNEAPMDTLLVEETERRQSKKSNSLVDALAGLSTEDGGVKAPLAKSRYIFKKLGTITAGQATDPEQSKRIASNIRRRVGAKRQRNQDTPQLEEADWSSSVPSASQGAPGEEDCMGKFFHVHDINKMVKRARRSNKAAESPAKSGSATDSASMPGASTPTSSNMTLNGETLVRKPAKVNHISLSHL
jgi:hypothetical protein